METIPRISGDVRTDRALMRLTRILAAIAATSSSATEPADAEQPSRQPVLSVEDATSQGQQPEAV